MNRNRYVSVGIKDAISGKIYVLENKIALIPSTMTFSDRPFMKGDVGYWENAIYESIINNNVWTPTAYPEGWKLLVNNLFIVR